MPFKDTIYPLLTSGTLARVAGYAMLLAAYAGFAVWKELSIYERWGDFPAEIHAALTLVLGWLLVFRTNTAYNRWWEARTLWGGLVNASRNLSAKFRALPGCNLADRTALQDLLCDFASALRDHLRSPAPATGLKAAESAPPGSNHIPVLRVTQIYQLLWTCKAAGRIDGDELRVLDTDASRLLEICGGCERIRNTRIAFSYRVFARQCVFLFLITFPWGIVQEFQGWTIPLTGIMAYFMLGLETVAEHVEEPFGHDDDDLDLDGLCDVIDRSVRDILRDN